MTKKELSEKAGVSLSFLSDLTNGKANPSLKVMESLAIALEVPLSLLLECTDLDQSQLDTVAGYTIPRSLPVGYEYTCAVLPEHQAYIVKKWANAAQKKIRMI